MSDLNLNQNDTVSKDQNLEANEKDTENVAAESQETDSQDDGKIEFEAIDSGAEKIETPRGDCTKDSAPAEDVGLNYVTIAPVSLIRNTRALSLTLQPSESITSLAPQVVETEPPNINPANVVLTANSQGPTATRTQSLPIQAEEREPTPKRSQSYYPKPVHTNRHPRDRKRFHEIPEKAVFMSGFDCTRQNWNKYRDQCYRDIITKYHVYIRKFDLPTHGRNAYLHLKTAEEAEKLLSLKNYFDEVNQKQISRIHIGGTFIKVYKYEKTQKRIDEEIQIRMGKLVKRPDGTFVSCPIANCAHTDLMAGANATGYKLASSASAGINLGGGMGMSQLDLHNNLEHINSYFQPSHNPYLVAAASIRPRGDATFASADGQDLETSAPDGAPNRGTGAVFAPSALALGVDPNMLKIGDVFGEKTGISLGSLNDSIITNTKLAQTLLQNNWPVQANFWPSDMQVHLMVLFYQVFYTSGPIHAIEAIQAPFRQSLTLAEVGKIQNLN